MTPLATAILRAHLCLCISILRYKLADHLDLWGVDKAELLSWTKDLRAQVIDLETQYTQSLICQGASGLL